MRALHGGMHRPPRSVKRAWLAQRSLGLQNVGSLRLRSGGGEAALVLTAYTSVEASKLEHDRPPTPNQRRKHSINHPTSMFQLLESTVGEAGLCWARHGSTK